MAANSKSKKPAKASVKHVIEVEAIHSEATEEAFETKGSDMAAIKTEEPVVGTTPEPVMRPAYNPGDIVVVRNGYQGRLVYKSKKTGERFVWDDFDSEQDMELSELRSARSSHKKYFINNWFMFDDPGIVEHLGLAQYYRFALKINEFDALFDKSPGEIERVVSKLSDGQRRSLAYRAKQMIADEQIDSKRTIAVLERCLGIEFSDQ